jgi:hypothetical protein
MSGLYKYPTRARRGRKTVSYRWWKKNCGRKISEILWLRIQKSQSFLSCWILRVEEFYHNSTARVADRNRRRDPFFISGSWRRKGELFLFSFLLTYCGLDWIFLYFYCWHITRRGIWMYPHYKWLWPCRRALRWMHRKKMIKPSEDLKMFQIGCIEILLQRNKTIAYRNFLYLYRLSDPLRSTTLTFQTAQVTDPRW